MQLTDAQLAEIKDNYLANQKTIREWMQANSLTNQELKPQEILQQLKDKYGDEIIQGLMIALRQSMFGRQIPMMTGRLLSRPQVTVEQCDLLISKLQDALVTAQAKKAELEG